MITRKLYLISVALMPVTLGFPAPVAANDTVQLVRPMAEYVGKKLLNIAEEKIVGAVVDSVWDAVTGKPDLAKINTRLTQLEQGAALRPEMQDEIHKLRQQINDRVTRDEFRRMADQTAERLRAIEQRLDEHDEEIETLKVLQEDVRKKTTNSESAAFFRGRGEGYERDGQKYKAAACYNIAIRLAPKDPLGYLRRCEYYIKLGAGGVAVTDAAAATRLDPKSVVAHYYLGLGHLADGGYKQADDNLTRAITLSPPRTAEEERQMLLKVLGQAQEPPARLGAIYAARGAARFYRGQYDLAEADCKEATDRSLADSGGPIVLAYRTQARLALARLLALPPGLEGSEAARVQARVTLKLALDQENPRVRERAGKEIKKAGNAANMAVGLDPKDPENYLLRAEVRITNWDYENAVTDAGEAIRLAPKSARAYYLRGLAHFGRQNYDAAVKDYTESIKLDPLSAAAHNARAEAYPFCNRGLDDLKKAIADANEAVRLDPNFVDAYCNLGRAYARHGLLTDPLGPFDPELLRKAAQQARDTDFARALFNLSFAIRLDPKYAKAYGERSITYTSRNKPGDQTLAEADLKEHKRLAGQR